MTDEPYPDQLAPCPFCGRPAHVMRDESRPTTPLGPGARVSIGCMSHTDAFSTHAHWHDDCLSPTTMWMDYRDAVTLWNRRQHLERDR